MLPRRRRSPLTRAAFGPAAIAMAIGVVLSLAGALAVARWEQRVANAEFEGVAETQAIILQNGMNEYISRLVGVAYPVRIRQ